MCLVEIVQLAADRRSVRQAGAFGLVMFQSTNRASTSA